LEEEPFEVMIVVPEGLETQGTMAEE
jgi:hypothetical protein